MSFGIYQTPAVELLVRCKSWQFMLGFDPFCHYMEFIGMSKYKFNPCLVF